MFNIVLLEPEKPTNVGNIGRTCFLTESRLHLIRPFKFNMDDKTLRRTGLDYWKDVDVIIYDDYKDFLLKNPGINIYYATTKANNCYSDAKFEDGDFIMFGKESAGIPESILKQNKEKCIRIPMTKKLKRSLNLSNSVAIILYEALRQNDFNSLLQFW